ncbi:MULTISPECIES: co-chaperone GroES [unclassified Kitasatospora]|uniref:co-chaperone GroES n=1 Tax=unclassified Kitasatospora TaxID=2633591 RepID=UPI0024759FFB|nr:co-chaperone GroES [Kitasatospora sp. MAA19]MDH6707271.1 chaperonin GroES [Kitasatospora sp. MAA19]
MPDFHPKHDRLIVKPIGAPTAQDPETWKGEVVAVGPGRPLESGKPHPVDVKVGEKILFNRRSGSEIEVEGESYVELPEDEVLALSAE